MSGSRFGMSNRTPCVLIEIGERADIHVAMKS